MIPDDNSNIDFEYPDRHHPVHGVHRPTLGSTIVFLTVCTKDRMPWLATAELHTIMVDVWKRATAWLVGRYVIMPDHVHLFASPGQPELPLENWVRFWKSQITMAHKVSEHRWQADHWDRRLRTGESYAQKWEYVRDNPVRAGLVGNAADWPYQGEIHELKW